MNNIQKDFIIKQTPDYYIERQEINGEVLSKPIRKRIREIAYAAQEYIYDEEIQQASMVKLHDANDVIFNFFKNEPDDVFTDIIDMYTEEYTAIKEDEIKRIDKKTEEALRQIEDNAQFSSVITIALCIVVFLVIFFLIFKK